MRVGLVNVPEQSTRFAGLRYAHIDRACWRFVDADGDVIGPIYATKAELLADLPSFASERGYEA